MRRFSIVQGSSDLIYEGTNLKDGNDISIRVLEKD